jgi:hypothetical protein
MSEIIHLPARSDELSVPYVDLSRGVPLADHLARVDEASRAGEALGWDRGRRYYEHETRVRVAALEVEITARVRADLDADREQNRLAWMVIG